MQYMKQLLRVRLCTHQKNDPRQGKDDLLLQSELQLLLFTISNPPDTN